ncbi:acyl-CoA thioesterase [Sphingomonas adhaesiva]|uniref:Thioesterase n=1 Tax=Sphingomonas adhaesiva TaxID=28212 RepID=A0A2A4I4Y7_9SPHN|nr:thioesterase family protein [Sphingomonas adhaesiva]PCG13104.1 thioesterase [Sphingomonas adhaesiva]
MTFRASHPLRFAHCDPAGIAYYPRYLEICDAAVEDWTAEVLGVPRRVLHLDMALALPTVKLEAEFTAVSRLGDLLDIALDVVAVGRTSVDLHAAVTSRGRERFAVGYRQVLVEMPEGTSRPWPEEWRVRLEREMAS